MEEICGKCNDFFRYRACFSVPASTSAGSSSRNPQNLSGVKWDLAFNTSASFITNTNWQAYSGESTLSYLTQALGLTVQNFVSAATGIAVLFALIRGFIKVKSSGLGSFWVDLTRIVVHILPR